MAKARTTVFFCTECGFESAKWEGQCPSCHAWNSFSEAPAAPVFKKGGTTSRLSDGSEPVSLSEITTKDQSRIPTGMKELNRVLGGGIVPGSMVLVGGDPGIGKSTLLLQLCRNLAASDRSLLYVSGEESPEQIRLRADRMGHFSPTLKVLCETDLDRIVSLSERKAPEVLVVDSIQTMSCQRSDSAPGSVSQVRECTMQLLTLAKGKGVTVFIVGHVTKEGTVAGPRMLEHMVDTVLYFEGDRHASYRILRGVKNRFGSTNEIGVFEMGPDGLSEVENPSEYMLNGRDASSSGSVVTCSMEGTRPVLVEIQALVTRSGFGNPRRTAAGFDYNRFNLLLAVLEKRLGLRMGEFDAYLNIAGGMRMNEPAMDLGVVLAVLSSFRDSAVDAGVLCFGEVGLSGEVRSVSQAAGRIAEARRLGFRRVILPAACLAALTAEQKTGIELVGVANVSEAQRAV